MNPWIRAAAAALLVLALALLATATHLAGRPGTPAAPPRAVAAGHPVVVTTRAVRAGQPLRAEDLRIEQYPVRPGGAHGTTGGLLDRRLAMDLAAGTPVLDVLLASGLSLRVPPGERAVAVRVDETIGIGHRVRPGDRVDLFLLLKRNGDELAHSQSRLLLPALLVLGYGADSVDGPAGDAASRSGGSRDVARTAVLSVPLAQVNQLLLGANAGQFALALRNPDDTAQPDAGYARLPPALPLPALASDADRAAAGLRLDTLSAPQGTTALRTTARRPVAPAGATTATARPRGDGAAPPRAVPRTPTPPRPAAAPPRPGRVEVLRPSGREFIDY